MRRNLIGSGLWLLLSLLWLVGCPGTLDPHNDGDDDDVADDDATDDDDNADDDTGDDDTGDDDTGDDDTGDDDTGDDDDTTSPPPNPGLYFDITSGMMAGYYAFEYDMFCGVDNNEYVLTAAEDMTWLNTAYLFLSQSPYVGMHAESVFGMGVELIPHDAWRESGGPDCYMDVIDSAPSVWGTFHCEGLWAELAAPPWDEYWDVENGVFRCP